MIGLQPAVVCVTASGGGVQYFFQCFNFEKSEKKAREAGLKKYLTTNLLSLYAYGTRFAPQLQGQSQGQIRGQ